MKNLRIRILMTVFALGTILWGCDSLIYDDIEDCPQGVYVKFYSMTPCAVDSSFIGDVSSLVVFAFDEKEKLLATVNMQNVNLTRDFEVLVPVSNGNYSFIAWTGVNEKFTKKTFTLGETSKKDVMFAINSTNNVAVQINAADRIWHGESPVISLPDPNEYGSQYKHTAINLRELTNRVNVIVEFDKVTMKNYDPKDLTVAISSTNGTVNLDGSMPLHSPEIAYQSSQPQYTDISGAWNFSLLDLNIGQQNKLKITYWGNKKEEVVFNGDLIAGILMNATEGGSNLNCDNDFTIKFVIKDYCVECWSHFGCAIYVNNWYVHSYNTEFRQ